MTFYQITIVGLNILLSNILIHLYYCIARSSCIYNCLISLIVTETINDY